MLPYRCIAVLLRCMGVGVGPAWPRTSAWRPGARGTAAPRAMEPAGAGRGPRAALVLACTPTHLPGPQPGFLPCILFTRHRPGGVRGLRPWCTPPAWPATSCFPCLSTGVSCRWCPRPPPPRCPTRSCWRRSPRVRLGGQLSLWCGCAVVWLRLHAPGLHVRTILKSVLQALCHFWCRGDPGGARGGAAGGRGAAAGAGGGARDGTGLPLKGPGLQLRGGVPALSACGLLQLWRQVSSRPVGHSANPAAACGLPFIPRRLRRPRAGWRRSGTASRRSPPPPPPPRPRRAPRARSRPRCSSRQSARRSRWVGA